MFCKACHGEAFKNVGKPKKVKFDTLLNDEKWPKKIIADIEKINPNFNLCPKCDNKVDEELIKFQDDNKLQLYLYSLFLLKKLYIDSIKAALFFNFITNPGTLHHTQYLIRENKNFEFYLRYFLSHTYNHDQKIFSIYWKGSNYYNMLLFDNLLCDTFDVSNFNLKLINDCPIV
jgi:hypothetical protein